MKVNSIRALFLYCMLLFTGACFSQSNVIDSLENELKIIPQKDTARVTVLNLLAYHNYRNNPPKSIEYIGQALALADELKFVEGKARGYYIKGAIYMEQGSFHDAIEYLDTATHLYDTIDDIQGIAKCKNVFGVLYSYQGDYKQSLKYYEEALALEKRLGVNTNVSLLYNIGNLYSRTGEHENALLNFRKVLEIEKANKDAQGMLNALNSIGSVYYTQGNYPLSLKYYKESLEVAKNAKDSIGIFQSYINTGNVYRMQNLNGKALKYYNKALGIETAHYNVKNITALKNNIAGVYYDNEEYNAAITNFEESVLLSREIEDAVNLSTALNGLGFVYLEMNKNAKALNYFREANTITLENNLVYDLLDSYHGMTDAYYQMGKYGLALQNGQKLVETSYEHDFLIHKKNAHGLLHKIYKKKLNYEKALEHHELFKILSDSLFNEEKIESITQLEYEYKYKQELESGKNRELKLTKTVKSVNQDLKKTQQNIFKGVIAFLLVTILFGGFVFYLRLRNVKSKIQNITMEQKLLRSQMTPHFIFNSMAVLQGMILNKEDGKAVSYLSKFSRLLRITLENSRDKTVQLGQELVAVRNYLELLNVEEEASYAYTLIVDEQIDLEKFKVSPMLIQPFVENAIEHAFVNQKYGRKIDINLKLEGKSLICTIKDNGIGILASSKNKNQNKNSLSTTITSERLKILSRDFKMQGSVTIEDRKNYNEQGTIVTLYIPYKNELKQ